MSIYQAMDTYLAEERAMRAQQYLKALGDRMLNSIDMEMLAMALGESMTPGGFNVEQYTELVDWARATKVNAAILDLIFRGYLLPVYREDGKLAFDLRER